MNKPARPRFSAVRENYLHYLFWIMLFFNEKICSVEILFFSTIRLYSFSYYECDPLSPPKGEATHGVHPLDPLFSGIITNPLWILSQYGEFPSGGKEVSDCRRPQYRPMIKTDNFYRAKLSEIFSLPGIFTGQRFNPKEG